MTELINPTMGKESKANSVRKATKGFQAGEDQGPQVEEKAAGESAQGYSGDEALTLGGSRQRFALFQEYS